MGPLQITTAFLILASLVASEETTNRKKRKYDGDDDDDDDDDEFYAPPNSSKEKHISYDFSYNVHDDDSGSSYSHKEERKGLVTTGEYRVSLPDGRIQIVTYIADENGYRAKVTYEPVEKKEERGNYQDISHAPKSVKKQQENTTNGNRHYIHTSRQNRRPRPRGGLHKQGRKVIKHKVSSHPHRGHNSHNLKGRDRKVSTDKHHKTFARHPEREFLNTKLQAVKTSKERFSPKSNPHPKERVSHVSHHADKGQHAPFDGTFRSYKVPEPVKIELKTLSFPKFNGEGRDLKLSTEAVILSSSVVTTELPIAVPVTSQEKSSSVYYPPISHLAPPSKASFFIPSNKASPKTSNNNEVLSQDDHLHAQSSALQEPVTPFSSDNIFRDAELSLKEEQSLGKAVLDSFSDAKKDLHEEPESKFPAQDKHEEPHSSSYSSHAFPPRSIHPPHLRRYPPPPRPFLPYPPPQFPPPYFRAPLYGPFHPFRTGDHQRFRRRLFYSYLPQPLDFGESEKQMEDIGGENSEEEKSSP